MERSNHKVHGLFIEALDVAPERRAEWVAAQALSEAERELLTDLLERDARQLGRTAIFDSGDLGQRVDFALLQSLVGVTVGDCVLERPIAAGGMGLVFEATQHHPRRRVAVKLLRSDKLERGRARFEEEVQLLARLTHPNIAQIYSAGVCRAELGGILRELPYYAMEFVPDARTILEYCTQNELGLGERVALFIPVCEAVQHGHQRGIVHRDLKPDNILITGDGVPKVIDFGIARSTQLAREQVTRSGELVGTVAYLSPEQVLDSQSADVRSDLYALGVVLFELLTGQSPYRTTKTLPELLHAVANEEPRRPSQLAPQVAGDLEWILLRCLAKDPEARYAGVDDLQAELQRYLECRPVLAGPPGLAYRFGKFARRSPGVLAALGLAALSLAAGGIAAAVGYADARAARTAAESSAEVALEQSRLAKLAARDSAAVAEFLVKLFGASDPAVSQGKELSAKELLDAGAARLEVELGDQPEVRRSLRMRMGSSYAGLGEYARAKELFEQALGDSVRLHGEDSPETADACYHLASTLRSLGSADARPMMERALALRRAHPAETSDDEVRTLVGMAAIRTSERQFNEALALFDEALALLPRASNGGRELRQTILAGRAHTYYSAKKLEAAVVDAREAIELHRELHGPLHPGTLASLNTLALSLKNLDRAKEAEPVFEELLQLGEAVHGADSSIVAIFASNRAGLIDKLGRREEAAEAYEAAWKIFCAQSPPTFPQRLTCGMNLALTQLRLARWRRAEELYAELAAAYADVEGATSHRRGVALTNLSLCLVARGELDGAETILRDLLAVSPALADGGEAERQTWARGILVQVLLRKGQQNDARRELEKLEAYSGRHPELPNVTALWKFDAALMAAADGRLAEAQALFAELGAAERMDESVRWFGPASRARLAVIRGDRELAERAVADLEALLGSWHVETLDALESLAALADAAGDVAAAGDLRSEIVRRRALR